MGNLLLVFEKVITASLEQHGYKISYFQFENRQNKNILEVKSHNEKFSLYIKESTIDQGFWGLNPKYVEALESSGAKWFLILLLGSYDKGYLLPGEKVNRLIQDGLWSQAKSGSQDYKIHDNESELPNVGKFNRFSELLLSIARN